MSKGIFSRFISVAFILISVTATAGSKIDSYLETPINSTSYKAATSDGLSKDIPQNEPSEEVEVFIKTTDTDVVRAKIEVLNGNVRAVIGDLLTAKIAKSILSQLSDMDEVVFIEGARPINFKDDVALTEINATEVQQGSINVEGMGDIKAYTGKGVIVGIIDTGIDYSHPDFLDAEGKSRVLAIWDQNKYGGQVPAEIENSYGTECGTESIANGSCILADTDGHGTHVSGIAAGKNEKYGGVAPDANIIVVSYDSSMNLNSGYADTIFSTKICEAAYYIFVKAAALGKPAVVNLSLGTHIGAHDGTSLFEECLSGLVKGNAGRVLVAAAGNEFLEEEYYKGIHTGFEVVQGTDYATNFVMLRTSKDKVYYIDLWGEAGSDLSVGLTIHDGTPKATPLEASEIANVGDKKSGTFLNGGFTYLINATEAVNSLNNKQHVGIRISVKSSIVPDPKKYSFDLIVKGRGKFDAWVFPDKPTKTIMFTGVEGNIGSNLNYVPGDSLKTIAIPATSANIIAVAAYTTRNEWDSSGSHLNTGYELGNLVEYSSSGPTAAPDKTGIKPNIAAPGAMIVSAMSSDSNPNSLYKFGDGEHVLMGGTSMAAPFVTGTAALMFELNPNFTHADIMKYISEGAYTDDFAQNIPDNRWGYGKLDVLGAMANGITGGATGNFDPSVVVPGPNGGLGSTSGGASTGGCAFIPAGRTGNAHPLVLFLLAVGVMVCHRRRSFKVQVSLRVSPLGERGNLFFKKNEIASLRSQ